MTQEELDTIETALRHQGLTWNQTNFAVAVIRNYVEPLRQQLADSQKHVKLLRDALEWYGEEAKAISKNMKSKNDMAVLASVNVLALDAGNRAALAATDHGSTHQDKAALFKALGLVPWDNKPPACTDTVWIEPGKIATKESRGSKP